MSYRDKTPQIISVLTRKLKPGKTVEDFQTAHLPPGDATRTEFGHDVDYFEAPPRVINAVSAADPTVIISIGLTYGEPESVLREISEKIPLEKERHNRIAAVADKIGPSLVYFVTGDDNLGGGDPVYEQEPLPEMTPKIIEALEQLVPQKK